VRISKGPRRRRRRRRDRALDDGWCWHVGRGRRVGRGGRWPGQCGKKLEDQELVSV